MTSVSKETLALEIGVFAGLVADLDQKDDNALSVLVSILNRLSTCGDIPAAMKSVLASAEIAAKRLASGDLAFKEGYDELCDAAEEAQRWLRSLDSTENPGRDVGVRPAARSNDEGAGDGFSNGAGLPTSSDMTGQTPPADITAFTFEQTSSADIAAFISECRDYLDSAELSLVGLEKDPSDKEKINELFRCFHNIKGTSGFLALSDMQGLAHVAESLMEGVRSGRVALSETVAESGFHAIDTLGKMLDGLEETLTGKPYVPQCDLEALIGSIQDLALGADGHEPVAGADGGPSSTAQGEGATLGVAPAAASVSSHGKTKAADLVRVSTGRLDSLVDAVGELVIANSMVSQEVQSLAHSNPLLARNMDRMNKTIRELQELATGVRMITLEGTFRKMIRVVRDTAAKSGALVDFSYIGGETEIDRNMVEEIASPLVHLVRNAVDHGLEPPAERERLGKPRVGKVRLSACHQGGNVVIRVEDDGGGLSRQKILEKAVSQGLVKPGADLADKEIYQLIYQPGFSTALKVTEVSGRGVGMDVVKQTVENLHGRIDITTAPGLGTTFTIRLPLTMAIIEGMVVSVASQRYIIPVSAIQESLRPARDQIFTVVENGEMLLLRGAFVPLVRLHRLFRLQGANEDPCSALVIIIRDSDQRCAVLADDLIGQQQVVVKPLDGIFRRVEVLSGAAIVGDGTVSLILDPNGLIQTSKGA